MANTIRHKRNATAAAVPSAASLSTGELAINTADGKLFTKKDDLSVIEIGIVKPNVNNNFTALQTLTAGLKLEDAALNTTILSQDNTTSKQLEISSYYSGSAAQFPWLKNESGDVITIGDLNATNFSMSTVWDCENGTITTAVGSSSIYMDSSEVTISGVLTVNTATGNISATLNNISASSLTANNAVNGKTIVVGAQSITSGTATATTATLVQTAIVSVVSASTYSSVKYFIQARNTTTSRFQITEIVATRNATTTVITATPVNTNTGGIACTTYAVDISGGNFRLLATPQAASSTIFKVLYTAIP